MGSSSGTRASAILTQVGPGQPVGLEQDYVEFHSRGAILICGPASLSIPAGRLLARTLRVVVCATEEVAQSSLRSNPVIMFGRMARISGHLGRFTIEAWAGKGEMADLGPFSRNPDNFFDLVLDLNTPPLQDSEIKPLGYHAPGPDGQAIAAAIADLATLTGTFRKPRDIVYDQASCVHAAQGVPGCTRCLAACPAGAIGSDGGRLKIDAQLCQGCATCMVSCPTGALRPTTSSLEAFKHRGGAEKWLDALARGAPQVVIELPADLPTSTRQEITRQLEFARAILGAVGESPNRIRLAEAPGAGSASPLDGYPPQALAKMEGKREVLRAAIACLHSQRNKPEGCDVLAVKLPEGTPLGTIDIHHGSCTLCMACVNLCPTGALRSSDRGLTLSIIESQCVQCQICERGCPEQSISRRPRLLLDAETRRGVQKLNADAPHHCPGCDKPFTGQALLRKSMQALTTQGALSDAALARLHYCPDCRIHSLRPAGISSLG